MTVPGDAAAGRVELVRHVAPDHPAFAGHFPGRPIWPGVLLLAEVYEALKTQPQLAAALGATPDLQSVKFLSPVGPGTELLIAVQPDPLGAGFEIRSGEILVAKGRLRPSPAP